MITGRGMVGKTWLCVGSLVAAVFILCLFAFSNLSACNWFRQASALVGVAAAGVVLGWSGAVRVDRQRHHRDGLAQQLGERSGELARLRRRLAEAERIAQLGHWERDLVTGAGFWSDQNFQIYGLEPGAAAPELSRFLACVHPDDRRMVLRMRGSVLAGSDRYEGCYRVVRPDGKIRNVHVQAEVIRDGSGKALRLVGTTLDVTAQHAARQALEEGHAALTAVINATEQDLIILFNPDGTVRFVNQKAAAMVGRSVSALIGLKPEAFMPADTAADRWGRLQQVLTTGLPIQLEESIGDLVVETHLAPARGPDGSIVGVAVFCRNITDLKVIQNNLRKLARVIEQAPLSVVITNLDGTIEYVNPHFTATTGYPAAAVLGQNPRMLKSGYTTPRDYQAMWRAIASGEVWHGEFHNQRLDGRLFWESATIAPVRDDQGRITHYVAVKEDITERKRAEHELLVAKERAEAANVARSQFLASVSHELRTPLNAIIGFSECMREAAFGPIGDERYQRFAASIYEAGSNLLQLINDILDLADAEAGTFQLSETVIDPRLEVMAAVDGITAAAEQKDLTVEAVIPEELPLLFVDERAIRQIADALLSNAVKFTPSGGRIAVSLGVSDAGLFTLTVSDTGIGIPADKLGYILEPFGLLDAGFTREHTGTGLGLPLSRSMAEMHGGHLDIETTLGQGTTVTVRFPKDRLLQSGAELEQLAFDAPG